MSSTPALKQEEASTPITQTPTPTSAYSWNQVIDPALQQQSAAASAHYQYNPYYQNYGHYQHYIPPTTTAHAGQASTATTARAITANATTAGASTSTSNPLDTSDVATLNDALGSAGVDLKAEEESLQRTSDGYGMHRSYEDRSHKQPAKPNFDTRFLGPRMREIGKKHKVSNVPDESVSYVALALRTRLQDLLTSMIAASTHRTGTSFDRTPSAYEDGTPMWSVTVTRDVAKQLAALERAEREEEMRIRRERKESAAAQASSGSTVPGALAGNNINGGIGGFDGEPTEEEGPKKKKKKMDGPGVTAKNMSEDQRKKMSNAAASHAMGSAAKQYSWMTASVAAVPTPKSKATATSTSTAASPAPAAGASSSANAASAWSRPYVSSSKHTTSQSQSEDAKQSITLRDALFVVERERGHGGGRGAAQGWT